MTELSYVPEIGDTISDIVVSLSIGDEDEKSLCRSYQIFYNILFKSGKSIELGGKYSTDDNGIKLRNNFVEHLSLSDISEYFTDKSGFYYYYKIPFEKFKDIIGDFAE